MIPTTIVPTFDEPVETPVLITRAQEIENLRKLNLIRPKTDLDRQNRMLLRLFWAKDILGD